MSGGGRVLIVEDDPDVRRALERFLVRDGWTVVQAADGAEAVQILNRDHALTLVVSDLDMPHADGREVLKAAQQYDIPVVIVTGVASVETAVDLMRRGAANYVTKPFSPPALRRVLDECRARNRSRRESTKSARETPGMIGESAGLRAVVDVIGSVAETDATVLLMGESGTGKEVAARAIHAASRRAHRPFVAVNCGAIPEALLESELFGHAKGAFTGATHSRAGRFELAEGGTLFLDEIGDMPLAFQVRLLRVLQERQYTPLGDNAVRPTDVRVISATHRDLRKMVAEGTFREDLFYRINVVEIALPALRERREDIPMLVRHFLDAANARHGREVGMPTPEAMEAICRYDWPGNIRQLSNVIERMVVLRRTGAIALVDLPPELRPASLSALSSSTASQSSSSSMAASSAAAIAPSTLPETGLDLRRTVAELEYALIDQALARTGGNRNAAAQLLGLNRTTLVEKLKRRGTAGAVD
jgi:DNA-binding NtrC family response regulator